MSEAPKRPSLLDVIGRLGGAAPKIFLRDSPSEHGGSPMLDASSPEFRQFRQLPSDRGNHELLGEIARGGMGVILKGHDRDLGRDVAVKVLKKELTQKPEIVARFVEEAQIGGQLQHPGIVPVYELGLLADERPYFTMKLVKGRTLAALLTERSAPDADRHRFLGIFEQVCQTMAYAHSKGVIHRDLKPANVMVGAFGEVQVLDWGLAKVLAQGGVADERRERERASHATIISTVRHKPGSVGSSGSDSLAGSVMGTPAYMPPEQARGEVDHLDERSDVFSLGAILCEILTGQPPYAGAPDEVMEQAANAQIDPALARLSGCGADAALVALAKRCLAPAPTARARHAGIVAQELATWRAATDERTRAAQIAVAEARVKADEERRARRLTLALAGAVIVILTLGGGGWGYLAWQRGQRQAQTARQVEAALADATLGRGQKRWRDATVAVEQAAALLDAGQPTDELRRRVREQAAVIAKESAEAARQADLERQNQELLAHLSKLRSPGIGPNDLAPVDEAYVDAFSAYGLELDELAVDEAVRAITERGIAVPIAAALDDWGSIRSALRKSEDADHVMRIAELLDPDPTRRRLRAALRSGDLGLLKEFSKDEELARLPALSLCLLADAFLRAKDERRAIGILRLARVAHPGDFTTCVVLAEQLAEGSTAEIEEAAQCYFAALALQPELARIHVNVAKFLVSPLGEPARGIALFERAVKLDPEDEWIRRRFGWALIDLGDPRRAVEQFREGVRLEPEADGPHASLAVGLVELGDLDGALDEVKEALRLNPRNEDALESKVTILLAAGDVAGAVKACEETQKIGPKLIFARWNAAMVIAASGDRTAARRAIEVAIERTNTREGMSLAIAADALLRMPDATLRDPARAATFARAAIELAPKMVWAWQLLGAALYRSGDWNGCIEAIERSLQYSLEGSAFDRFHLALACEQIGRHAKALEQYQEGVAWMERQQSRNVDLVRLRAEAGQLLQVGTGGK